MLGDKPSSATRRMEPLTPRRAGGPYRPRYLVFIFALIMLVVGVVNYAILVDSQKRIIEHEAVRIAEVATSQAVASRTVYSSEVVDKLAMDGFGSHREWRAHKGMVPLPAQFLKLVGQEAGNTSGLYRYGPLSKWNLGVGQGLKDDFQRWAWQRLEEQDQVEPKGPTAWSAVWRFEQVDGVRTLRYMRADAASTESCVSCHNAHEREPEVFARRVAAGIAPGKQWKQHQLLGAIEANIPVDSIDNLAADSSKSMLALGLAISLLGFAGAAFLAWRDLRRERAAAIHFEEQSRFDALTRLGNRTFFDEHGEVALANARRTGTQAAVLFIDLDHFKQINDTHGHLAGDRVLREVADRLTACLRETDLITRQGGDEFIILLSNGSGSSHCEAIATKLLAALEPPVDVDGVPLTVSASIGISCCPEHGETLSELVDKADIAMYHAKRNGRHGYQLWREGLLLQKNSCT